MRRLLSLCVALTFLLPTAVQAAGQESIVAVVNQGVITASDLKARVQLVSASSGMTPSKELSAKLRPQILTMLIEEQLRVQEADRLGIKVTDAEVDEGFTAIAKQNNIPATEFKKMLQSHGINIGTMRDQIRSQLAWTKVVQKRIRPRVEVSDADIDSELDRIKENIGKDQYLVAQILIPMSAQTKTDDAGGFAAKLADQLKKEPESFPKAAKQFSASAGADKGGLIGWVMLGQLPQEVDAVLPTLNKGDVSRPIQTSSGYYILQLRDKRQLSAETLPSREDIMERLGMERLDRAARRYFLDLRSSAFIEKRG